MRIFVSSLKQNRQFFTHPKRVLFFLICSVVLTSFLAVEMEDVFATEGINETINFQGRVANTDGTNVTDGNYDFIFRLYKADSGGSAQWTETWDTGTSQVAVTNGIFRVALGTHSSLSSLDFNDDSWYLSVEFNNDDEMEPRIRFASVPYALNAKKVSGLTVTDTTGTFTLADGKTFVVNNGLTFSGTDSTTFTFPSSGGNIVTEDFAQTLTNKTIGSTGLIFSGATTDITTVNNENLVISPNGTGNVGFGNTDPSYPVHISLTGSDTDNNNPNNGILAVDGTLTSSTRNQTGILSSPRIAPGSASNQFYLGLVFQPYTNSANLADGSLGGMFGGPYVYGSNSVHTLYGVYLQNQVDETASVTDSYGAYVDNPYKASGATITTNHGLFIVDQTSGTSDFGLTIEGADTQALWLGSGADNTDSANGIAFGSSRDTTLYRSASNTLATGGDFRLGANSTLNPISSGTLGVGTSNTTTLNLGIAITGTTNVNGGNINLNGNANVASGNSFSVVSGEVAVTGKNSGSATTLRVNNHTSTGSIFVAQDAATDIFTVADGGNVILNTFTSDANAVLFTNTSGVITRVTETETGDLCLLSGSGASGAPTWASCPGGPGGSASWALNATDGTLNPINNTLDLLVGGTATASAKFAILGVASDSPIASLSATTGFGLSLGHNGIIQTTRNQTLTLGGDTTGNILLSPLNGAGLVTVNGTLDAATGGSATFVVAASDSPTRIKAQADYVADGTADEVQIQAAIDALPTTGGQIQLAQGTYNLADTVSITANKRIGISGYGAILRPATSVAAITVNQGISNAQGAVIEGVTIDGQSNASTTGILLEDTNNPAIYNVRIVNVTTGIHINSEDTNAFVEGLAIEDVLIRDCTASGTGISLTTNNGTGSFAQHQWRTVKIANCDTGINLASPSQFYRSYIENATIWIGEDQNGIVIDGDVLLSRMEINVEAATGSSGHTAITIGSNATNTEHLDFYYTQTGTVDTILSNSSNKHFTYKKNRNWFTSGSMPALQMYAHGDSQERLGFRTSFSGGGGLLFGPGGATVADTNLYRAGVDTLKTDDSFTVGSNLIIEFPGGSPSINTSNEGMQSASIGNLDLHARGSYRIFMDSNNNSSDNLRIFGDGTSKELLRLEEGGGKALLSINNYWSSQDIFTASSSGETRLRLDSSGNLGLGVLGADTIEGQLHIRSINDAGDATLVLDADRGDDSADKWSLVAQASDNDLSFVNDATELFKVTSSGSVYLAGGQNFDTLSNNTLAIGTTNATTITFGRTGQGITLPGFDCSALTNGGKLTTTSGGVLTCSNDTSGGGGGSSNWVLNPTDGTLSPINNTLDFLWGGSATDSAKFAILNTAGETPIASLSAGEAGGAYLTADGILATTANQSLILGSTTTGNINIGTDATARTINIGNTTGATGINLNTGTGNLAVNTSQFIVEQSTGDIGIGTSNPSYDIDIRKAVGSIDQSFYLEANPGTTNPFASLRFSSYSVTGAGSWTSSTTTADTAWSIFHDSVNNVIYAGDDDGFIYRCEISTNCDASGDWTSFDTGNYAIYSFTMDTTNEIMYAGIRFGLYRCNTATGCDAGGEWTSVGNLISSHAVQSMEFDATNGVLYAGVYFGGGGQGSIFRCDTNSQDCAQSADWTVAYAGTTDGVNVFLDQARSILYAIDQSGVLFHCDIGSTSCDATGDWTSLGDLNMGNSGIGSGAFTVDTTNNVIYLATVGDIARCEISTGCDDLSDWTAAWTTGAAYAVTFDSANDILYAGTNVSGGEIIQCDTSTGCDANLEWTTSFDATDVVRGLIFNEANGILYATETTGDEILRKAVGSIGGENLYAQISAQATDTDGVSEDGALIFNTSVGGTTTEVMRLMNGMVGINTDTPSSALFVTRPLSMGATGKALAIFDQIEDQDIIAASSSGTTVFRVTQDGSLESAGHMGLGNETSITSSDLLNLVEDYSGTSDFTGINTQITKSTAGGEFYGIVANPTYTGSGDNSANNFIGINSTPFYSGSGDLVNSIGIYSQAVSMQTGSSGVVGSAYGLYIADPSVIGGTGTVTDNIGIYVASMTTGATSDVGIAIDAAQTQTLWLDAHGLGTTTHAGIAFGSARDTFLYRSGSNTLTTGHLQLGRLIFPSVNSFDSSIDYVSTYVLGDITTSARGDVRFIIDSNNNSVGTFRILANGNSTEIITIDESGNILGAANSVYDTLTSGTLGIGTTTATTITIGRSGQTIALAGYTNSGSGCGALSTNGSGVITCSSGGGSQTPWTSDIDGDNFSLLDMGTNITARNGLTVGTGSNGNLTLTPDGTGDVVVSGDGDTNFQVNFSAAPTDNMVEISNSGQGTTTSGVAGLAIDFTQGDDSDATDINMGIFLDVTSSSGDADALIGMFIDNITGGSASEFALVIGEGWDSGLTIASGGATNSGLVYTGDGRPTKTITLSPEYAGAVLTDYYGAGTDSNITGAMTSDTDTTQGTSIRNYYQWLRTTDSTQHFYTVAVRVTLPADFDAWATSNAVVVNYITGSATNTVSDLDVRIYNENDSTVVASSTDNASTSWTTVAIDDSTLDDGASSEWDAAGETAVIYLRMGSASSNHVRVGDIKLNYLAKF